MVDIHFVFYFIRIIRVRFKLKIKIPNVIFSDPYPFVSLMMFVTFIQPSHRISNLFHLVFPSYHIFFFPSSLSFFFIYTCCCCVSVLGINNKPVLCVVRFVVSFICHYLRETSLRFFFLFDKLSSFPCIHLLHTLEKLTMYYLLLILLS